MLVFANQTHPPCFYGIQDGITGAEVCLQSMEHLRRKG